MSEQRKYTPAEVQPAQPSEQVSPLANTTPEPAADSPRLSRRAFVAGGVLSAIGGAMLPDFLRGRSASAAPETGEVLPPAVATPAPKGRDRMLQPRVLTQGRPVVLRRELIDDVPEVATIRLGEADKAVDLQHFGGHESFAKLKEEATLLYKDRGLPSAEDRVTLASSASGKSVIREADMQLEAADAGFVLNNHTVPEPFATYWQTHGGLAQQGLPITELYPEYNPTNNVQYPTQYFERARFEQHTENQPPYDVLLGLLGREQYLGIYKGAPAANEAAYSGADKTVFNETGKSVNPDFMKYWLGNGGLAQQGLPISEQFIEKSRIDGKDYLVQYFERARFELHPENQPPYNVLLGLLGVEQHGNPEPSPVFNGWRKEFGDPNKIVFHNESSTFGVDESRLDNVHTLDALYATIDKFSGGSKFNIYITDDTAEIQSMIDKAGPINYDPHLTWSYVIPGQADTLEYYKKEADGSYSLYVSLPKVDNPSQKAQTEINHLINDRIWRLPYQKDEPINKYNPQPSGYGPIVIQQIEGPYGNNGDGALNWAFKMAFK